VAGVHIDPQFFAALEKTLSDLDKQTDHDQLKYRQQGGDEPTPLVDQADAPPSDTSVPEASAIAPPAPAAANPNGQTVDAISQQPLGPLPGPAA
jgi:hypothetical protein